LGELFGFTALSGGYFDKQPLYQIDSRPFSIGSDGAGGPVTIGINATTTAEDGLP
jgi:hypothetical protein